MTGNMYAIEEPPAGTSNNPSEPSQGQDQVSVNNICSPASLATTNTSTVTDWAVEWSDWASSTVAPAIEEHIVQPTAKALHNFFYTTDDSIPIGTQSANHAHAASSSSYDPHPSSSSLNNPESNARNNHNHNNNETNDDDEEEAIMKEMVEAFWKQYDQILIISLGSILGILARFAASKIFTWTHEYNIFHEHSVLFTSLPLNCFSCFIMGLICSGEEAMKIIYTRITNPATDGARNGQRVRKSGEEEMREVALEAYERRIRASTSIVLFPARKEQGDVLIHYHSRHSDDDDDDDVDVDGEEGLNNHSLRLRSQQYPYDDQEMIIISSSKYSSPDRIHVNLPPSQLRQRRRRTMTLQPQSPKRIIRRRTNAKHSPLTQNERDYDENYGQDEEENETQEASTSTTRNTSQSMNSPLHHSLDPVDGDANDFVVDPGGIEEEPMTPSKTSQQQQLQHHSSLSSPSQSPQHDSQETSTATATAQPPQQEESMTDQISKNIHYLTKLRIAEGWDVGTTAHAMQNDILLGLRVGLCGAIGTFSSWNSQMVSFLRQGQVGAALIGYLIGLELPILAYRTGQYVAVYVFIWRRRREIRRDERRGYGLRIVGEEDEEEAEAEVGGDQESDTDTPRQGEHVENNMENHDLEGQQKRTSRTVTLSSSPTRSNSNSVRRSPRSESRILNEIAMERTQPSIRAILTAVSMLVLVCILTSLRVFTEPSQQQFALSLLFTPFGGLARWKISNAWNKVIPSFPLGTFTCNMVGCALSGSLGSLLAGNPGPNESIVLSSIIDGFGGALSTLTSFVVEVLALIDPLLFRFDGITYAYVTIIWAIVIGLLTVQSNDWADEVEQEP